MYHKLLLLTILLLYPKLTSGPMHDAVRDGDLAQVKILFEQSPASINHLREVDQLSPLHCSVYYDQYEIAQFLLAQKGHIDVDSIGQKLSRPLHIAASENKIPFIKLLLEHGADADAPNIIKNTPLMLAIDKNHHEAIELLLPKSNINASNKAGITAFAKAAEKGNAPLLQKLYDRGAAIDETSDYELTPLIIACHKGNIDVVRFLLNTQKVNINRFTKSGLCPLRSAVVGKNFEVLKLLLQSGVNPEVANSFGDTILHTAAEKGDIETIEIVSQYSNINAQNNMGNTPIHIATFNKNVRILRYFISLGARTDIPNNDGKTLWHLLTSDRKYKPYISACKKAQKEYQDSLTNTQNTRVTTAQPTTIDTSKTASNPKKKKKKKSRSSKKKCCQEKTATKVVTKKTSTIQQYFNAAKDALSYAPGRFDPHLLRIWPQVSTLIKPQKPKITHKSPTPTIVTQFGTFHGTSYTLNLFNCFEKNPELTGKYSFKYGIDYSRLYSPDIETRLQLITHLESDGLEHLLIKDSHAPIPTLTCTTGYLSTKYKDYLLHPKIGGKLDLYHLVDFNPDLIHRLGITFEKIKENGFKTVEVRIPGELTFTHNDTETKQLIVLELSFRHEGNMVGECIHRFARPIEQVKEKVVLEQIETFKQQYLDDTYYA